MQSYVDLRNIFEVVNNEFSKRIEESVSAKRSLEKELARVSLDNKSGKQNLKRHFGQEWIFRVQLEAGSLVFIFEEI